jgi:(2R)-sulfolactate sulfo-lyase subunit alpha
MMIFICKGQFTMEHKFLVHKPEDSVGVAITDIDAGEKIIGIVQDNNSKIELLSVNAIHLGHKIAIKPIPLNAKITIFGWPCGYATQAISLGEHVHVHNIKSMRWR